MRYLSDKRKNHILRKIAWKLPEQLVMWAYLRVVSYATTGKYSKTVVPELTAMDAIERWNKKHEAL